MKKICLRQEEKVKSSFFGFNNVVTRCFSCKLKEVEDFFCSHKSLFVLVCVILFRWNEEVRSLIFEFLSRAKEMCHGIEGHTEWSHVYCKQLIGGRRGEKRTSLQNITNTHFLFCPDHYSFSLQEDTKHSLNHTTWMKVMCNF